LKKTGQNSKKKAKTGMKNFPRRTTEKKEGVLQRNEKENDHRSTKITKGGGMSDPGKYSEPVHAMMVR